MTLKENLQSAIIRQAYAYLEKEPEKNQPKLLDLVEKLDATGAYGAQLAQVRQVLGDSANNWVIKHTAILHFCGKAKPWKPRYIYRFGALYLHYMQLAERMLNA